MKTPMSETIDLVLTQAIERYVDMSPEEAYNAIVTEWHEQMAAILIEFFFKTTCNNCDGMPDFIELPREQGGTHYVVPLCSCDWE